ncbi:UNVERIFIED_CONTAM: basic helix-loop-helix protein A [Sesamum angustifolium]|uniref:Basic helix-loop-helix protein A n=1 Tax=Sesamum angustifolium TaxID=2727405 RepID=A0AAW2QU53_9LAMI
MVAPAPAKSRLQSMLQAAVQAVHWTYSLFWQLCPQQRLPGKAYAKRQHIWLSRAYEVDSKIFSRAILAKTVVCIPLLDGVVELGTTQRVEEDIRIIQRVKSFFTDAQNPNPPRPVLSEHSTSNPPTSSDPPPASTVLPPHDDPTLDHNHDDDENDENDSTDDQDSDSDAETGRVDTLTLPTQPPNVITTADQPSELMELDMSEDIRLGSPKTAPIIWTRISTSTMPTHRRLRRRSATAGETYWVGLRQCTGG